MVKSLKVAVIGAGVAGLASARELGREGHHVVVYEKSDQLGGTWVYDPRVDSDPLGVDPNRKIVHSSLYSSLCANFPRQLMGFSDYTFQIRKNGELKTFPGHEEVLKFLNEFAMDFGLVELIRFNTEVVRVERVNDQWMIKSRRMSGLILEEAFDAVVVCNGHNTRPRIAVDIPGIEKWPGKQIHSHNYRVPGPFQDQIECVYENGEVAFQDGASVHADIILHCTGFNYDFPFLETNGMVTVDDRRVGPLYKHVFPPELAPSLSFVGIPYAVVVFHMLEFQARWVASVLSGKVLLPLEKEMQTDIEKHYRHMEEAGIPKHHTHRLPFDEFGYLDWLAAQVGEPGMDEGLKEIYMTLIKFFVDKGWAGFRESFVENIVLKN
ncbi:Flavin-containing monooxygenase FMO GS-OX-like 3 [Abeliophyllum distichum]|uniref:Flavin-containing monooxygenase n=1 Tax=Abeliophyllum distichum TaxID=126358 RepID=A0ABD1TFG3_9LAMI